MLRFERLLLLLLIVGPTHLALLGVSYYPEYLLICISECGPPGNSGGEHLHHYHAHFWGKKSEAWRGLARHLGCRTAGFSAVPSFSLTSFYFHFLLLCSPQLAALLCWLVLLVEVLVRGVTLIHKASWKAPSLPWLSSLASTHGMVLPRTLLCPASTRPARPPCSETENWDQLPKRWSADIFQHFPWGPVGEFPRG